MAHPLELAEPNVIDEELVRHCITTVVETSVAEDKKKEMKTEMDLNDVKALSFSFQNILKIDNLNGLQSLVKLQLDNNIIEKVENIEHLLNLEWLDLSFNNIQHIQGLSSLTKLTDLSLFNNRIEKLKGLDTLTDLQCLSVGHNLITDVVQAIHYLRPFANLRMLNMAGNPCSRDPEYHTRIIAHLKGLVYVDYRLVDPEQVLQAREQYQVCSADIDFYFMFRVYEGPGCAPGLAELAREQLSDLPMDFNSARTMRVFLTRGLAAG